MIFTDYHISSDVRYKIREMQIQLNELDKIYYFLNGYLEARPTEEVRFSILNYEQLTYLDQIRKNLAWHYQKEVDALLEQPK